MADLPVDAERRGRLLGAQLRGLVGEHLGTDVPGSPIALPIGAAMLVDRTAWVLVDGESTSPAGQALGRALAWALRNGADRLALISDTAAGTLARRAERFDVPIEVWFPEGRTLLPAVAEPLAEPPEPSASALALIGDIEAAGADVVVEHGVVTGEVRGLEVCRVVDRGGDVRLEVGVGEQDRDAFQIVHGDRPTIEALTEVVDTVRGHRRIDAPQHPLNRLSRERFLRWRLTESPAELGLVDLTVAPPPVPRSGLADVQPCRAVGTTADGEAVDVVFTIGVDLDLAPFVADVQALSSDGRKVVVVLRAGDYLPVTAQLLDLLNDDVDVNVLA